MSYSPTPAGYRHRRAKLYNDADNHQEGEQTKQTRTLTPRTNTTKQNNNHYNDAGDDAGHWGRRQRLYRQATIELR